MSNIVKIAIDAMGGENSPKKIIEGIEISLKTNQKNFFYLYGKKNIIENELHKKKKLQEYCEIINAYLKSTEIRKTIPSGLLRLLSTIRRPLNSLISCKLFFKI